MHLSKKITLTVGSRESPLSKVQVEEVLNELRQYHPEISFQSIFTKTIGDRNKHISLRDLGKTDFFTKEIDEMQLRGECRISIHSAKDLADPLPKGLTMVALTKGVDPSDVLVMRPGMTFEKLPSGAKIATSSFRREEMIRELRQDLMFVDIRGIIQERLDQLISGKVDGVVMAEAAIIRLGLTHLNRMRIEGEAAPLQGQLAVIARDEDLEMRDLFKCINVQ